MLRLITLPMRRHRARLEKASAEKASAEKASRAAATDWLSTVAFAGFVTASASRQEVSLREIYAHIERLRAIHGL